MYTIKYIDRLMLYHFLHVQLTHDICAETHPMPFQET